MEWPLLYLKAWSSTWRHVNDPLKTKKTCEILRLDISNLVVKLTGYSNTISCSYTDAQFFRQYSEHSLSEKCNLCILSNRLHQNLNSGNLLVPVTTIVCSFCCLSMSETFQFKRDMSPFCSFCLGAGVKSPLVNLLLHENLISTKTACFTVDFCNQDNNLYLVSEFWLIWPLPVAKNLKNKKVLINTDDINDQTKWYKTFSIISHRCPGSGEVRTRPSLQQPRLRWSSQSTCLCTRFYFFLDKAHHHL